MGGRGSLGTRDFKYVNKKSVLDALKEKNITLMRNGKPVTDSKNISNKELATLSVLAETLNNRGSITHNIIDIAPTRENKPMTSSKVKKGDAVYRKLTVNDKHIKQGYKHMNNLYKKNGGLKQVVNKKLNKKPSKPKTSGNPRTEPTSFNEFLAYAKSLGK